MLNSSSEEGLQGRNRLILKWYCTKIVTESAECVYYAERIPARRELLFLGTRQERKKPSKTQTDLKIYSTKERGKNYLGEFNFDALSLPLSPPFKWQQIFLMIIVVCGYLR